LDGFFISLNPLAPQRFAETAHSLPSLKTA